VSLRLLLALTALAALAALACSPAPAAADPDAKPAPKSAPPAKPATLKPPCPGCMLDAFGAAGAKQPLLVVLHGDHEQASTAAARWRAAAKTRGWALLALQCPAAEKCGPSWWQWNGDPRWIRDRVADVAAQIPIDPERTYLAGWSGGATYMGLRAPAWPDTFAAVVIHGGGMAPREETAPCPTRTLPAYFLVGNQNPLHELAQDLRDYFTRCKQELRWDLIAGADHPKEDAALDGKRALAILDWLAAHPRVGDRQSTADHR
jgi:poly(3-hydroxybutyrate) depolymerase